MEKRAVFTRGLFTARSFDSRAAHVAANCRRARALASEPHNDRSRRPSRQHVLRYRARAGRPRRDYVQASSAVYMATGMLP